MESNLHNTRSLRSIAVSLKAQGSKLQVGEAKDSEGNKFVTISYKQNGQNKYINLSSKLSNWTVADVIANADKLEVGDTQTKAGNPYTVAYLPGGNFTDLFADL